MVSEVSRQAEGSQPTQPNPNQFIEQRPVVTAQASRSSDQEIETRFSLGCKNTKLFAERLEKEKDTKTQMQIEIERCDPLVDTGPTNSRR